LKSPHEDTVGLLSVNNSIFKGQRKFCSGQIAHLIIISRINDTGCFTQECLSTSNSTITILANNPNPKNLTGSTMGVKVVLGSGHYTVVQHMMSTKRGTCIG
jgi:hypothetical protein